MVIIENIRKPVVSQLEAFEAFITDKFKAEDELLGEMLSYALSTRGKGVRPMLVMLSAAMNAQNIAAADGVRPLLAATLVEMIHLTSLIHDDVIDESDMRRGKPSVNAKWQSHKAVLLGDYILAKNMGLGMSSGQYDLVSHVCGAMATLCEGEMLQDQGVEKSVVSREQYLQVIHKKTASLLGVSASIGALAVGAERKYVDVMRRFGEALGMAFQIQDDILDYTPTADTGKPSNNDLREGKITIPLLILLEKSTPERQEELLSMLRSCASDESQVTNLQQIVEQSGALELAQQVMQNFLVKATQLLSEYPESEYRDSLINLCAYVGQRDK